MAGQGNRFRNKGYQIPKHEITVKGRSLFNWSIGSLKNFFDKEIRIIFISLKSNRSKEFISKEMKYFNFKNWELIELAEITKGQASTAMYAELKIKSIKDPILIFNIDTFINYKDLKFSLFQNNACIPCFKSESDNFSYVKVDSKGKIIEIEEKIKISNLASVGLYGFKSFEQFKISYNNFYLKKKNEYLERYIAPIYKELILKNDQIDLIIIPNNSVKILGTPEELQKFRNET